MRAITSGPKWQGALSYLRSGGLPWDRASIIDAYGSDPWSAPVMHVTLISTPLELFVRPSFSTEAILRMLDADDGGALFTRYFRYVIDQTAWNFARTCAWLQP